MDERLIRELVEGGATLAAIAETCGIDRSTARRRLQRLELETRHQRTLREAAEARAQGRAEMMRFCSRHGLVVFRIDSRGTYRCTRCNGDRVMARRRRIKEILIAEMGGSCLLCGYRGCPRALEFHHLEPENKSFGVGFAGVTRSLERARAEASKCVLLCANCHAEVEAGVTELP